MKRDFGVEPAEMQEIRMRVERNVRLGRQYRREMRVWQALAFVAAVFTLGLAGFVVWILYEVVQWISR